MSYLPRAAAELQPSLEQYTSSQWETQPVSPSFPGWEQPSAWRVPQPQSPQSSKCQALISRDHYSLIIVGCNESFQHVLKPDVLKQHCNTAKPTFISTFYSSFLVYLSCAPVTKAAKQQAPGDEEDEEAGGSDIGTESWNTQSAASAAMKLPVLTQPGLGVTTTTVTTITQTGGDWSSSLFNVCGDRTTCEADTALGLLHCIVHTQV